MHVVVKFQKGIHNFGFNQVVFVYKLKWGKKDNIFSHLTILHKFGILCYANRGGLNYATI